MFKISAQFIQSRSVLAIGMALLCIAALPAQAKPEASQPATAPKALDAPKPLTSTKSKTPLPDYLESLRTATNPGHGPRGAAAVPSPLYEDFRRAIQAGDQIQPEIEQMLQTGTPVGKIYAAALLMQFDPDKARLVLESMQSNQTQIIMPDNYVGVGSRSTVGQWATNILNGDTQWLPQAMPFSLQLAPPNPDYKTLQQSLVRQKRFEQALEVAEQQLSYEVFKVWKTYTTGSKRDQLNTFAQPPNLAGIRNIAKTQKATLVEYSFVSDDLLYIWVIKPEGAIAFKSVDLTNSPTPLAKLIRQSDDRQQNRPSSQPSTFNQQLYQILIAPIASDLPKDPNDRVIFIPGSQLASVSFAALQTAQGQYLIENHTISTSPSIHFLALTQTQRQKSAATDPPLIVGNPISSYRDTEQSPLLGAEKEAKTIAAIMGTQPLIGKQATKQAVLQTIATSNVIHLATNGFADFGDPRLPGSIVLGLSQSDDGQLIDNGLLTAIEVADFNINADLVVLSTGNLGQRLPQSFLIAGASSVIAPLWDTDDVKVSVLMTEFYRQLKTQPNKAVALRQAMLVMLKPTFRPLTVTGRIKPIQANK